MSGKHSLKPKINEGEMEKMLNQIRNAPETTCQSNHIASTREGLQFPMPRECTGEGSYRFIYPRLGEDRIVCSAFKADYDQWSLIKDVSRVIAI